MIRCTVCMLLFAVAEGAIVSRWDFDTSDLTDSGPAGNNGNGGYTFSGDSACGMSLRLVNGQAGPTMGPKPANMIPLGNNPFTMSTYVKVMTPGLRTLFHIGADGSNAYRKGLAMGVQGNLKLAIYWHSGSQWTNIGPTLALNTWHFIVFQFDGTNLRIFLDELLVKTYPMTFNLQPSSSYGTLQLGERHHGGTPLSRGGDYLLDAAILGNSALSINEIRAYCKTAAPPTAAPPTPAPPTPAPPTPAPPTNPPLTPFPDTAAPPTLAPPTPAPPTPAPPTPAPPTLPPLTPFPDTAAPPTPAPPTPAPPTLAPPTLAPPTLPPLTPFPDTAAPPTLPPLTPFPDTAAPPTPAPPTPAPPTLPPLTPFPDTAAPPTPAPPTNPPLTPFPDTTAPLTQAPPTPAPATLPPLTPFPDTAAPLTPAPPTLPPLTPFPDTAAPPTPAPPTPAPPTLPPLTPFPDTAAPPTSAPPTNPPLTPFPDTAAPPTQAPPTPAPATLTPLTPFPDTAAPLTSSPSTLPPLTPFPDTAAPPTLAPSTSAPPTNPPLTPFPDTAAPPTQAPLTPAPPTLPPLTPFPDTATPLTQVPPTSVPPTLPPLTPFPDTAAPLTPAPLTAAPPTQAPPTLPPLTPFPDTAAPTPGPDTTTPDTLAPATTAPLTVSPPTLSPDTPGPPTKAPVTQAPETLVPPTASPTQPPLTVAPVTVAPMTLAPPTLPPLTPNPGTAAPDTPAPPTPTPPTVAPLTPAPDTLAPVTATPTQSPATLAPVTITPATFPPGIPVTSIPATQAPATFPPGIPATDVPATQPPATFPPGVPATNVPATQAPSTFPPGVPSTDVPPTQSPATFPPGVPATDVPPTLAPPTFPPGLPATDVPSTQAPVTFPPGVPLTSVPTLAPATFPGIPVTNVPVTDAPPTQTPVTSAPPTQPPTTLTPSTMMPGALPTFAPATLVPAGPTFIPATPAPASPTFVPQTAQPSTPTPGSGSTTTGAPMTFVPPGHSMPTPMPPTTAPLPPGQTFAPTAVPPVPIPTSVVPIKVEGSVDSLQIQSGGSEVVLKISQGGGLKWPDGFLPTALRYPGGEVLFDVNATEAQRCGGGPCMVVETLTPPSSSGYGLAATAEKNSAFISTTVVSETEVRILIQDRDFRAYSGYSEDITFTITDSSFATGSAEAVCRSSSEASQEYMTCQCNTTKGQSGCNKAMRLTPQQRTFPNDDELTTSTTTAAAVVAVLGVMIPVTSPSTGSSLSRVSILSRTSICPSEGKMELDRSLNPSGLELGSGDYVQVNGAVVASILVQVGLIIVSLITASIMYRQMDARRVTQRTGFTSLRRSRDDVKSKSIVRIVRHGLSKHDRTYLAARARFGWILLPATFLYGGAMLSCITAILYSSRFFKVIAAFDLVIFGAGLPYFTYRTAVKCVNHSDVHEVEGNDERSLWLKTWWGTSEWVQGEGVIDGAWVELHRLFYDGYHRKARFFMTTEFLMTFVVSCLGAWEPTTIGQCWIRGGLTTFVTVCYLLYMVWLRPYLAPYENVLEIAFVATEVVMLVLILIGMGEYRPTEHWSVYYAGQLAFYLVWCILLKAITDGCIFVIDEYAGWKDKKRPQGFLRHLLCCGNNIQGDTLDEHVLRRFHDLQEELEMDDAEYATYRERTSEGGTPEANNPGSNAGSNPGSNAGSNAGSRSNSSSLTASLMRNESVYADISHAEVPFNRTVSTFGRGGSTMPVTLTEGGVYEYSSPVTVEAPVPPSASLGGFPSSFGSALGPALGRARRTNPMRPRSRSNMSHLSNSSERPPSPPRRRPSPAPSSMSSSPPSPRPLGLTFVAT
eukprot:TRINITY_DN679_c0_g1_i1.p1 TRINITY_DN679_c0_g1~~TRINITY_DN679_c0_g1_i1.p1  ORF type:complete len:1812 (+),score=249.13 TRINITY_DN679_c0_g1_i1:85-5520(+)